MEESRKPVADNEYLYRRSYLPERKFMNPDGTATSRVFKLRPKDEGRLSVNVKSMTTAEKAVKDPSKFFLFEISNISVRAVGLNTYHDPVDGEGGPNPSHAVIVGMTPDDDVIPGLLARKSRRVQF